MPLSFWQETKVLRVQLQITGWKNEDIHNVIFLNWCFFLVDNISIYQKRDFQADCLKRVRQEASCGFWRSAIGWSFLFCLWDHFLGCPKILKTSKHSSPLFCVSRVWMDGCVWARELEAPCTLRCHGCWIECMGFSSSREHHARGERMGKVYRLSAFLLVREAHILFL